MTRREATSTRESQLLQGTLDMLILKVVALESIHGYAIVQRLQQMSREAFTVRQGSLYPALYRLEEKGFLRTEWRMTDTGREAKYYSLTKAGRRHLADGRENWRRFADAMALVLDTAE